MGDVAATLKVMPADADIDLDDLEDRLGAALPDGARIRATERSDVAFGLVAILASVVVPDDAGGTEAVEQAFADLDGVQSVSVENVGRL